MEDASLATTGYMTMMILPVGFIAALVGSVTLGVALFPPKDIRVSGRRLFSGQLLHRSAVTERFVVGVCAAISVLSLIIALHALRTRSPGMTQYPVVSLLLVVATLLLALPAILWRTQLRLAAEGLATIALALSAAITGASIGFAFVPLILIMIWICARHLWELDKRLRVTHVSSG